MAAISIKSKGLGNEKKCRAEKIVGRFAVASSFGGLEVWSREPRAERQAAYRPRSLRQMAKSILVCSWVAG